MLPWDNCRLPTFAGGESGVTGVQLETGLAGSLVTTVARPAVIGEDGADIPVKIDCFVRGTGRTCAGQGQAGKQCQQDGQRV
jgi:hypothetical protein